MLSAQCNYKPTTTSDVTTKDASIDLDTTLGCDGGVLSWDGTDFSDNSSGISVVLNSTSTNYYVVATCTGQTDPTDRRLDLGLENSSGAFTSRVLADP